MTTRLPEYLRTHVLKGRSLVVDLATRIEELRSRPGHHRGVALVKDGALNVVLTVFEAGGRTAEHASPGPTMVQVLEGRIRVHADDHDHELGRGQLVAFNAFVRHQVEALEPAAVLITVAHEPVRRERGHAHSDEELELALARLEREARRIDPSVQARISSYRWHDDDVFDIDLVKGATEVRIEVSCDRVLERSTMEPAAWEHDLEEAVHDLNQRAAAEP